MKKYFIIILFFSITLMSCEKVIDAIKETELSNEDIVEGLKTALLVGTDSSSTILGANDGYFKDQAVKILLPPEATDIMDKISIVEDNPTYGFLVSGAKTLIEKKLSEVELKVNRSAESAAAMEGTKTIFKDAITGMSITDALNILQGKSNNKSTNEFDSIAATNYFKQKTLESLTTLFAPVIKKQLDEAILGGVSTNDAWSDATGTYNNILDKSFLGISVGDVANAEKVNTNLGEYVVGKALDGLFYKVGEQEKKIRSNPLDWALDILHKVFG